MESRLQFDFATNQSILKKITAIAAFQSRWDIEQTDEILFLKQMKMQAMIESTGSSTRIEGSTLTNNEVESVLKNMKITQLKTRDEQEVVGYYEAKGYLNERQKQIIDIAKNNQSMQIADFMKLLPDIPRPTIKRDLSLLVERRLLVKVGKGRGVWYFVEKTPE